MYDDISDTQLSTPGGACWYVVSGFADEDTEEKLSSNRLSSWSIMNRLSIILLHQFHCV